MILGWMVGDVYKSVYVYLTHAPVQFLMCGAFQMATDAYILLQMFVLYDPDSRLMAWLRARGLPTVSPKRVAHDVTA